MKWLEDRYAKSPNRFSHDGFDYRNTRRCIPEFIDRVHDPKNLCNRPRSKFIPSLEKIRAEPFRAGTPTGNLLESSVLPAFPVVSSQKKLSFSHRNWRGFSFVLDEPRPLRKQVVLQRPPPITDQPSTATGKSFRPPDFSDKAGRSSHEINSNPVTTARRYFPSENRATENVFGRPSFAYDPTGSPRRISPATLLHQKTSECLLDALTYESH